MSRLGPVGIDFGTTKTALAYYDQNQERKIISFPTTVSFGDEANRLWETTIVGETEQSNPLSVWKNFKTFLGDDGTEWQKIPSRCHPERLQKGINPPTVVHLTALILRKIKLQFCAAKGEGDVERWDIGPTTITVPAFSNFRQRQGLIYAASVAGFSDISLIEEPVAAYLFHYLKKASNIKKGKSKTLVIDFGGGTCDLALIASGEQKYPDVLGTYTIKRGIFDLGGNDIDDAVINYWKDNPNFLSTLPQKGSMPPQLAEELVDSAKFAKERHNPRPADCKPPLSSLDIVSTPTSSEKNVDISKGGLRLKYDINYPAVKPGAFKDILAKVNFGRNLELGIDHLLAEQNLQRTDIGQVILAGGSCYIRRVLSTIRAAFPGLDPSRNEFMLEEPEFSIAYGALEYQKKYSRFNPIVRKRLSMSIYMDIGADIQNVSKLRLFLTWGNPKIHHNDGHYYIELARRGTLLDMATKTIYVPLPGSSRKTHVFKIHQVKPSSNGEDHKQITEATCVEEITIPASIHLVTVMFRMDRFGNYYRSVKPTPRITMPTIQSASNAEWNWRNGKNLKRDRRIYFQTLL